MTSSTRRRFLKNTALGLASTTLLTPARSRAAGAGERVRLGVIGCGNQGTAHLRSLTTLKDADIVYVCDIDETRLADGVKLSGGASRKGTSAVFSMIRRSMA